MEIPQKYDPVEEEKRIKQFWQDQEVYTYNPTSGKKVFSIDTPPPTMSGRMHIGHAMSYSQQDFIARFKRLEGFEVFYPFGTDDNGLPTEKLVQKEKKVNLRKIPREEAIAICNDYLQEARPAFIQDWKDIGMSCDFALDYSTISDHARKIAQKTFLDLASKGLAYRKKGPIMWDRVFQTAIAQAETEGVSRKGWLNYVKAKIVGTKNTYVIYATTRPELYPGVIGVSVQDSGRYLKIKVGDDFFILGEGAKDKFEGEVVEQLTGQDLIGEKVTIPFVEREIVITHDVAVEADFGTGIAYFCTYGGQEDIDYSVRHNLEPYEVVAKDGTLTALAGEFEGQLAQDARKAVVEKLEAGGHLVFKEKKDQTVNVGERSGADVEFVISEQWYVSYLDKKDQLWENAQKFNWYPDHMKHRVENWIKGLKWDWGISRQRHFGVPIPVWYDKDDNPIYPDAKDLPLDPTTHMLDGAVRAETDVFDTWFTSSSSPEIACSLAEGVDLPMTLRPQAHDIINNWLFYTMAKTNLLYDKNPFEDVTVSGFILAPNGTKMSKSKGNVVAPREPLEKYGADALRFWAATSTLGEDLPYMEKDLVTAKKIINKLWNAAKFASMHLEDYDGSKVELTKVDQWMLSKTKEAVDKVHQHYSNYAFAKGKLELEQFFWKILCDNYLEIVKGRLYNVDTYGEDARKSAQYTLVQVFLSLLKVASPIMPFITEAVYGYFFKEFDTYQSINQALWPELESISEPEGAQLAVDVIGATRRFKAGEQKSLGAELTELYVSSDEHLLKDYENDIKGATKSASIVYGKEGKEKVNDTLSVGGTFA